MSATLPCGCVVTEGYGHVHTKLCEHHKREAFAPHGQERDRVEDLNLDLVGG